MRGRVGAFLYRVGFLLVVLVVIVWAYNHPHQAGTLFGQAIKTVFSVIAAVWDKVVGSHHGVTVRTH